MATHTLSPSRRTLHGTFSPEWEPALRIDPGDTVVAQTLDARWSIDPPGPDGELAAQFEPRSPERDNGHALCGPIAVTGAQPGMVLEVRIDNVRPGSWGWTVAGGWENGINERLGLGDSKFLMQWDLDAESGTATNQYGQSLQMRPFMGVMGMPGGDAEPVPSWTPRPQGGNIDCKELVAGTTLYLPIAVPDAYFSLGDGHAAQGDGEISGTGIECGMDRVQVTLSLREDLALDMPIARTADAWITMGFHESLDEATLAAIEAMLELMGREYRLNRSQAMALGSVAVDLRVTQIVNGIRGVHAVFRPDTIGGL